MKIQISLLAIAVLLAGCSSVSEKIPTVKIEKRKPQTTVQTASYSAPTHSASYVTPAHTTSYATSAPSKTTNASQKEAAAVCETDAMREKVVDGNDHNDSVRIMVVQDSAGSSQLLSQVEINCRDYFLRKTVQTSQPTIIRASTNYIETEPETRRQIRSSRYTYIVQRGDTVWDIARQHCTTVKAVSRLNGLGRGNVIDIGQRLKMPNQDCD